MKVWII